EVEATIFRGYANKRHQGFLGHAVVGEWVNLGALTTNSDLKNNYGSGRVWVEGEERDSGESKVGCFPRGQGKTGIGTRTRTGSVAGVGWWVRDRICWGAADSPPSSFPAGRGGMASAWCATSGRSSWARRASP